MQYRGRIGIPHLLLPPAGTSYAASRGCSARRRPAASPVRENSDTVGRKPTQVTGTVYRHVIGPEIRGGATVADDVFGDDWGNENAEST